MSLPDMLADGGKIRERQGRVDELGRVQLLMLEQASVAAGAALKLGELVAEILGLVKKNG